MAHGKGRRCLRWERRAALRRALALVDVADRNVITETMVSPSYTSAFRQRIQLPSSSGMKNNLVVFEYEKAEPGEPALAVEHLQLAAATGFDVVVLGLSSRGFAARGATHLWLQGGDSGRANLMILLATVLANHPDWSRAKIERDEQVEEPQEAPRKASCANADESASQDSLPRPAAGSAGV